jgi:hypothetical protein
MVADEKGDESRVSSRERRENTKERFLRGLYEASETMEKIDCVLGRERFARLAARLKTLDIHASPEYTAFSHYVGDQKKQEFVWLMLASCGTELQSAWNMVRLAHLAPAKRSLRVALEHCSAAILEGVPISVVREVWKDCPKEDLPIREMFLPRNYRNPGASSKPLIPSSTFPSVLLKLLPQFSQWDESKVAELKQYLDEHLHPFAHGSAQNVSAYLIPTSGTNPVFGSVFREDGIPFYQAVADEVLESAKLYSGVLNSASEYLRRSSAS